MAERKTGKAIGFYQRGIDGLIERAIREDGAVFTRYQSRHPRYGYRWGSWNRGVSIDPKALPASMDCGFSTLYPHHDRASKLRLPA